MIFQPELIEKSELEKANDDFLEMFQQLSFFSNQLAVKKRKQNINVVAGFSSHKKRKLKNEK